MNFRPNSTNIYYCWNGVEKCSPNYFFKKSQRVDERKVVQRICGLLRVSHIFFSDGSEKIINRKKFVKNPFERETIINSHMLRLYAFYLYLPK